MDTTFHGYEIYKCDSNASGMKYYTRTHNGILKANTIEGVKKLIKAMYKGSGVFGNEI